MPMIANIMRAQLEGSPQWVIRFALRGGLHAMTMAA